MAIEYGVPICPKRKIRNSLEAFLESYRSGRIKRIFESPEFTVHWPSTWELIYTSSRGHLKIGMGMRKIGSRWYENITVVEFSDDLCWDGIHEDPVGDNEIPKIAERISEALTFFRVDHEFRKTVAGRWLEP